MFDILSTAELTVSASIAMAFLSLAMARSVRGRAAVLIALGAWFVLVLAMGATGALSPAGGGARRSASRSFCLSPRWSGRISLYPLCEMRWPRRLCRRSSRSMRSACSDSCFIVLYAEGRLPAPFAPSAGWGDVFIGATALPLAWAVTRFGARVRPLVFLWNAIGVADLVVAVTLGPLSAPGPLQVFVGPPDSSPMTTFALAHHPGLSRPDPAFHSRRHLRAALRQVSILRAGRMRGVALKVKPSRPERATPERKATAFSWHLSISLRISSAPGLEGM